MCHCFFFFFRIATSEKRFILHMQYGKRFAYGLSLQFQLSWITLGAVFFYLCSLFHQISSVSSPSLAGTRWAVFKKWYICCRLFCFMKHNNGFAVHKLALSSHSYDFIVCDSAREIHFLPSLCVCVCVCVCVTTACLTTRKHSSVKWWIALDRKNEKRCYLFYQPEQWCHRGLM